ncbi:MAG: exodeoxyribonuclease III [Chloroflexi bacterium]|nr:exodeoxyribonuclease III [Chloroflexota bacterium]
MKIATWNVNGIRARQAQFVDWVGEEQPDVVCLQELKASPSQLSEAICNLEGYCSCWHGAGPYSGVSLNVRADTVPQEPVFSHPAFDRDTRAVEARIGDLVVASVYVPNGGKDYADKLRFLRELSEWADERLKETDRLVVCGDMNVARTEQDVHFSERNPRLVGQRPDERELFESLLGDRLVDLGRKFHPDESDFFTWWAPWRNHRDRNIGWRIDYILASPAMATRAIDCWSQRSVGTSDHGPLIAEFAD